MKASFNTQFKALVLAAGLVSAFGAQASSTVIFDPTGTVGPANDVAFTTLDQRPGNALAIGASASSPVGTTFNLVYQSNLGSALDSNGNAVFNNGTVIGGAARNFTFTAGFAETITGNTVVGGTNTVLTFGFASPATNAPTATNFFYMYATGASGNNLAGTGFASGIPILTGHFISSGYSSTFNANGGGAGTPLDAAGTNDYAGVSTITGSGSTNATLVIDGFNVAYFPNLVLGATQSFIQTTQSLQFQQVDPSALMSSNGIANGDIAGATSVGTVNGINGRNTIFQADASQSFTTGVPEPLPAALIGLGLVALGLARRKAAKKD